MQNLAGKTIEETDKIIEWELERCLIPIVRGKPSTGEVQTHLIGKWKNFTFTRAWSYWIVLGKVPIEIARKMYANKVGKTDIRVVGHCGCPPPDEWVRWDDPVSGKRVLATGERKRFTEILEKGPETVLGKLAKEELERHLFVDNPESEKMVGYIDYYHIDSELGLYIFVQSLV